MPSSQHPVLHHVQAKLLEHNVRFGDPECQCLMTRLESDLVQVFMATASGDLKDVQLQWSADSALCVVMAAEGYPGSYVKNTLIKGLETVIGAKVRAVSPTLQDMILVLFLQRRKNLCGLNPNIPILFLEQQPTVFTARKLDQDAFAIWRSKYPRRTSC